MPHTVNRYLSVPNTGDDVDTWGTLDVNPNMNSIDGSLGGVASIALGAATTITLTLPSGASFTPGPGPSQSENALIKLTGTLTGSAIIKFTMPGAYIVHNACGSATFFTVRLSPASGGGNTIGAPPGRKCAIFFDGTDVDFVNPPEPGSALDLHQSGTALPGWMQVCSVQPYLIKDGTVYNTSTYPALGAALGSTFGGNGVTTFGVPDELNRVRVGIDTGTNNRLTSGVSGITGTQMGSAGGDQQQQAHTHTGSGTTTDESQNHTHSDGSAVLGGSTGGVVGAGSTSQATTSANNRGHTHDYSFTTSSTGSGGSQNVQPTIVSYLPLIKT